MKLFNDTRGLGVTSIYLIVFAAFTIGGTGLIVFRNQSKSRSTATNISNDTAEPINNDVIETINEEKTNLRNEQTYYEENNSSTRELNIEDLDIVVGRAVTVNWDNAGTIFGGVAVNLTLSNSTGSTIRINPYEANVYTLRDADNHIYNMTFSLSSGLNGEFKPLLVTDLAPGQSVTGYIGIQVPDTNVLNYDLVIGSRTYKINATKLESWPRDN